jgi:hypothetical protein
MGPLGLRTLSLISGNQIGSNGVTLKLHTLQQGLEPWLDGSLPCPDARIAADAEWIWKRNDGAVHGFIQRHVSPADLDVI